MELYVTYGFGNKFKRDLLQTDLRSDFNDKPKKAWWGSPIHAKYGWLEWCIDNYYLQDEDKNLSFEENAKKYFANDNRIIWTLSSDSKILFINNFMDLIWCHNMKYIKRKNDYIDRFCQYEWDFNELIKDGYAAIQLNDPTIGHHFRFYNLECILYSWDCESIVVLDQDKIIPCIIDNEE